LLLDEIYLGLSAYQALTDDEARRNWEKYGNPDGPGAMSFGIALPSWIVEKENSVWVSSAENATNILNLWSTSSHI
jgi:preprotein translocase subunit Sec63